MDKLFEKSIRVLEFDKILEKLKSHIVSDLAKEYCKEIEISTDIKEINKRLNETSEAVNLIIKKSEPPLFGIHRLRDQIRRAELGGVLSPLHLIQVSDFLRVSRYLKNYFNVEDTDISFPILLELSESLFVFKTVEDKINNAIVSENEISDNASSKLANIRRQIAKKKDAIRDKLNSIISDENDKKYLQDSLVTIREGRYVVPVKQENKSKIKGLVHDVSSSGQTAYIEPMAVVNLNNELRTLMSEERDEIERILRELSELVADVGEEIIINEDILKEIDFIFAKGKLALEMGAYRPKLNDKGYINLISARHPLLATKKIVPIDIYLGKDFTSLIITGPNTGGKTVTIKTVGLLTLMSQYGLHIPASESSEVSIFDKVLADIGDEQSIEQSLSTFSSHMVNIVGILEEATPNSLVIFDELGAGTDPTEGAALARSIMDNMLRRKIRTISTTHYNQLKIYALTTDGVANASMEFNVDTLSPTYRLLIGVPGKSNAFEISSRLGLPEYVIEEARKLISEENIEFEEVLKSIEDDRSKIEENRLHAQKEKEELEEKNRELQKEIDRIKRGREKAIEDAKEEARKLIKKAELDVELILSEISDLRVEMTSDQARRLQQAQELLRENKRATAKKVEIVKFEKSSKPIESIKIGDTVKSASLNTEGTVLELPDSDGKVMVQMGMIKMKLPLNTLEFSEKDTFKQKAKSKKIIDSKAKFIKSEIDLRGQNFEDARVEVEKYIDDAYLSGLKSIRIIHGKGTGVLRQKLREYLKRHDHVKSVSDAAYNEGGNGASVVELK